MGRMSRDKGTASERDKRRLITELQRRQARRKPLDLCWRLPDCKGGD